MVGFFKFTSAHRTRTHMEIVSESLVPPLVRNREADLSFSYSTSEPAVYPTAEPLLASVGSMTTRWSTWMNAPIWCGVDEDKGMATGWKVPRTLAEAAYPTPRVSVRS
jgi:hypothetical protein